jgi:hypothetical protein
MPCTYMHKPKWQSIAVTHTSATPPWGYGVKITATPPKMTAAVPARVRTLKIR